MRSPQHPQSRAVITARSTENRSSSFSTVPQRGLFDAEEKAVPGSYNDAATIRAALVTAIRNCNKSRDQIAEEMSVLTGTEVTVRRLNAFTAESREDFRFPLELVRAFCAVTGDYTLLRDQVELAGMRLISKVEYELLELGRQILIHKRSAQEVELIEKRLQGVDL